MKIKDQSLIPYEIHIDGSNHAIEQDLLKKDKYGKQLFKNHGYFSSFESALKKVISLKINKGQTLNLKEFMKEYRDISRELISKLN